MLRLPKTFRSPAYCAFRPLQRPVSVSVIPVRSLLFVLLFLFLLPIGTRISARENSSDLYKKGARMALNGDYDRAIEIFKKVIAISPYYCLGHYGLGKAYLYKYGMLDEAVRHLKLAVSLDKKLVKGYFYLGMAFLISGKYIRALHAFKNTYAHDDTYIEALYNIGVIYDLTGNDYEAGKFFDRYRDEREKEDEDIIF